MLVCYFVVVKCHWDCLDTLIRIEIARPLQSRTIYCPQKELRHGALLGNSPNKLEDRKPDAILPFIVASETFTCIKSLLGDGRRNHSHY